MRHKPLIEASLIDAVTEVMPKKRKFSRDLWARQEKTPISVLIMNEEGVPQDAGVDLYALLFIQMTVRFLLCLDVCDDAGTCSPSASSTAHTFISVQAFIKGFTASTEG